MPQAVTQTLQAAGVSFIIEPQMRYTGPKAAGVPPSRPAEGKGVTFQAGEQATRLSVAGCGNGIELQAFADESRFFAK